ncbi:MAG: DNA methyltransferase [Phototrophicales bacterium]|nr:MAG: DNA methyltransferase [Phototrophicales bacterium]RMG71232.1 MAG: DNA methyltransferase [Chloroflexota bacterium]
MTPTPDEILQQIYEKVTARLNEAWIVETDIFRRVELVSRNINNRAGVRALLACALAKVHDVHIDIRKPYTEIGDTDTFSGRAYDERFIAPFITQHNLPCNPTTAFLTPALRNRNTVLTPDLNLSGRPKQVYDALLQLLADVYEGRITAQQLLSETIRQLILLRNEKQQRMASLLANLKSRYGDVSLSAEQIITLIQQHLVTKGSSRLPVLIVTAAYITARPYLQERALPLQAHNAADSQTQALGDVQITLENEDNIITCYEMKSKKVVIGDIDLAVNHKLSKTPHRVDNYIFITTEPIDEAVSTYARNLYDQLGVEIVILDCIGFLRHFLHLFHRHRMTFLDHYQDLVLAEPDSAISQPLKEVFLTLRQAAESD